MPVGVPSDEQHGAGCRFSRRQHTVRSADANSSPLRDLHVAFMTHSGLERRAASPERVGNPSRIPIELTGLGEEIEELSGAEHGHLPSNSCTMLGCGGPHGGLAWALGKRELFTS